MDIYQAFGFGTISVVFGYASKSAFLGLGISSSPIITALFAGVGAGVGAAIVLMLLHKAKAK